MDLLINFAIFLLGVAVGYFYALFEFWIDKQESRSATEETAGRDDSEPLT